MEFFAKHKCNVSQDSLFFYNPKGIVKPAGAQLRRSILREKVLKNEDLARSLCKNFEPKLAKACFNGFHEDEIFDVLVQVTESGYSFFEQAEFIRSLRNEGYLYFLMDDLSQLGLTGRELPSNFVAAFLQRFGEVDEEAMPYRRGFCNCDDWGLQGILCDEILEFFNADPTKLYQACVLDVYEKEDEVNLIESMYDFLASQGYKLDWFD